jgi:SAM-dependent methyltransferase
VISILDRYQRIAPLYDLLDFPFETMRYRHVRPLLFEGLSGRILDAGVGTGRNIAYYPRDAEVVGVDLSPAMLARADRRARQRGRTVELHQMDVTRLAFPDQSFDAAVASFLFCVLPSELQVPALQENQARPEARGCASASGICATDQDGPGHARPPLGALDGVGLRRRVRSSDRRACAGDRAGDRGLPVCRK